MSDIRPYRDISHPIEGPSKHTYNLREMVQDREKEKTSMQPTPRRQEIVENEEKCRFEYKHLSSHFQLLEKYVDSEDKDEISNSNISLFKDQILDSVKILCQSDRSNPQMDSLKATQNLKKAAYDFRDNVKVAETLTKIFDKLDGTWTPSQPGISSSYKGKEHATDIQLVPQLQPQDNIEMMQSHAESQQSNKIKTKQAQDAIHHLKKAIKDNEYDVRKGRGQLFSAKKTEEINDVIGKLNNYKSALSTDDTNTADIIYSEIKDYMNNNVKEATDIINRALKKIETRPTETQQAQDAINHLKHALQDNEYDVRKGRGQLFSAKKTEEINDVIGKLNHYKSASSIGDANTADIIYSEIKDYMNNNVKEATDIINRALKNIEIRPTETQQAKDITSYLKKQISSNEVTEQQAQDAINHLKHALQDNVYNVKNSRGQLFSAKKTEEINDVIGKLNNYKSALSTDDTNTADIIYSEIKDYMNNNVKEATDIINRALKKIETRPTETQQAENAIRHLIYAIKNNENDVSRYKGQPFSTKKIEEINDVISKLNDQKSALFIDDTNTADIIYSEIKDYMNNNVKEATDIINRALKNIEIYKRQ